MTPFEQLQERYPTRYATWQLLYNNFLVCCQISPNSSLSVPGREDVKKFHTFILPYLGTNVLDIGCGPHFPAYLHGLPDRLFYGIDLMSNSSKNWKATITGYAERLPWTDKVFDSVIFGTSLDHVIDLNDAIAEACRVTKRYVLVWTGDIPPMPPSKTEATCIEGWWYNIPIGCVDPFHVRYVQPLEILTLFSQHNFKLLRTNTLPGSVFMALKRG